ncbi:MAG TPA: L,D-transpeptidase family protein [Acidimicrobiales bacterium]
MSWPARARRLLAVVAVLSISAIGMLSFGATATGASTPGPSAAPSGIALVPTPGGGGYWVAASNGAVYAFGNAHLYGSMEGQPLNQPIVGMAATPDGAGYWLVASDGGIFSFGEAHFWGSTGALHLNAPIVGMAPTADGMGYWLVASDGGIFSFGDAHFWGSTGALHLNQPVVSMAASPGGGGYWLVAADGGVFTFGDARFSGSTGALHLNAPIVGVAATPDGDGYWLVASDGGIFSFGDAHFWGSTGSLHLNAPIVGMAASADGKGYWLVAADGGVFTFGDASFDGAATPDIGLLVNQLANTGGARQVVIVDAPSAASTTATLYTFENDGSGWYQVFSPMPAVDGETGWIPASARVEGDGATPEGIYPFGSTMYGVDANPGTQFPYVQLTCGDWWDEDPSSPTYNTFQSEPCGTTPPFGGDSEALWTEGNAYPSMAVINFNTPPTGDSGSGIFLHANTGAPTIGCVSLPLSDLDRVLDWLKPSLHPVIVMGPDAVIRSY